MAPLPDQVLFIRSSDDIARVRRAVRAAMERIGGSVAQTTKLVTAASELARNTLVHGGGGQLQLAVDEQHGGSDVVLVFIDSGPGVGDLELALRDGYSTAGGLGLGLGGARRLCSRFAIDSAPGRGTRVEVAFRVARPRP